MANVLRTEKKLAVLSALVEGCSVRSTERLTGVHRDTVIKLMVRVGTGCAAILDEKMVNLGCDRLELDELWSFVGKKQRHVTAGDDMNSVGDQWVYVAIDATSKLIPSFLVGKRTAENTNAFVADVAARLSQRVQVSTDGLQLYVPAIRAAFGERVDYAQVVKTYEARRRR
jgi:transposase-like protein